MKRLFLTLLTAALLGGFLSAQAKDLTEWSTTAGSNNDAAPDGFPENMAPSGVNNAAREIMAAVKRWADGVSARNYLINGGFRLAQQGTSFDSTTTPANSDDTYLLDQWVLLSDGNDVVDVTQETTTIPTGAHSAIRLDVETGNKKFGIAQIIEHRDAARIIGGTVSLQFKARISGSSISEVRAGVACWDSTADSVTSDVVSAWGGAGTNPTLVANWTFENTPADLTDLTSSYQTYVIENISLDTASCVNVAVFIWIDDVTTTAGDFLYLADVMLNRGEDTTDYIEVPYETDLSLSRRFFERIQAQDVSNETIGNGFVVSTTVMRSFVPFRNTKRAAPTVTLSAAGTFDAAYQGSTTNCTSIAATHSARNGVWVSCTDTGAPFTAGDGAALQRDATDTTFIDADSRL